ncbi:MAG TPA: replication-associated recombination protein A, partial [Candidatus Angelobacter sp.]|nr:replication-associated recombination protein A [Candidatus Angelobacter sp.]
VYTAYGTVKGEIEHTRQEPVPLHLRNAPTRLMKELDYGKGYRYAHDEEGIEKRIKARLDEIKKAKAPSPQRHGDSER